jgi:hypothetical protein
MIDVGDGLRNPLLENESSLHQNVSSFVATQKNSPNAAVLALKKPYLITGTARIFRAKSCWVLCLVCLPLIPD